MVGHPYPFGIGIAIRKKIDGSSVASGRTRYVTCTTSGPRCCAASANDILTLGPIDVSGWDVHDSNYPACRPSCHCAGAGSYCWSLGGFSDFSLVAAFTGLIITCALRPSSFGCPSIAPTSDKSWAKRSSSFLPKST